MFWRSPGLVQTSPVEVSVGEGLTPRATEQLICVSLSPTFTPPTEAGARASFARALHFGAECRLLTSVFFRLARLRLIGTTLSDTAV